MKSLVVYYSETGNTEKVARAMAKAVGADLVRVGEAEPENIAQYDLLCVGTPVHNYGPARIVNEFLDNLPESPAKKAIGFCTFHAIGRERTLNILKEKLEEKGFYYAGGFSCLGQSRIVANFGPRIFNKGRPNSDDLKAAEEFAKNVLRL